MATATRLVNTDRLKAEIGESLTVTDVAERLCGVDMERAGDQWRGLCPLHDERTPSFYTRDAKNAFHCFGCKAGGDSIELVRSVRNLGFTEALYVLATEAHIDISKYERPLTEDERRREQLRADAEEWLAALTPDGIEDRVSPAVATQFGVGNHPSQGIVFPYRLPGGRLVGWKIRDGKRMAMLPHDHPLYEDTLFGIQVAREHLVDGTIILVEGEFDCMTAHEAGVRNVVAMGGSSLSTAHMEMLAHHHVRQVILVLDGDQGGRSSARAMAQRYWASEIPVRVAVCADNEDPDSLIREHGALPFELLTRGARHALEYLLWEQWTALPRTTLTEKLEFVGWIRETYGAKLRATDESLVLQEVAKWMGIPEVEIRDFAKQNDTSLQATDSERVVIGQALRDADYFINLRRQFVATDFYLTKHQRFWDVMARMLVEGLEFDVNTAVRLAENEGITGAYIRDLVTLQPTNLNYHEQQVLDMSLRRSARDEALTFKNRITDLTLPSEQMVGELTAKITERALRKSGVTIRRIDEQVDQTMEVLHERMRNPSEIHGLDLGAQFIETSNRLQGLQAKRLLLLSAASGIGKSTLMIQWATVLSIQQSIPVDIVSLEMDENEILTKIASHMTAIDSMRISGGALTPDEMRRVERAMQRIRKSPLHVWAPDGMNATDFVLFARESVIRRRTEAFFVDYIQLTDPEPGMERENGYVQYGHFGRIAKMKVARAMNVAVVCVAQLRREAAMKEQPGAEDMGDSYALVRHADVILILAGKDSRTGVNLCIAKNRQGIGGADVMRPLRYIKATNTLFEGGAETPDYLVR